MKKLLSVCGLATLIAVPAVGRAEDIARFERGRVRQRR